MKTFLLSVLIPLCRFNFVFKSALSDSIPLLVFGMSNSGYSTSVLFSQRPTLKTGILSALGLMPKQRFADYLKGNDIDDFRRDASMIAEDMNKVINGEREKDS